MKFSYRYSLDRSSRKFICPECGKKRFVRYVDQETGSYLPDQFGRCDREINCRYHLPPTSHYQAHQQTSNQQVNHASKRQDPIPGSRLPVSIVNSSLKRYNENHLVIFLECVFGLSTTRELVEKFRIGTSKHWPGATIFWQIDASNQVRSGKIILYNPNNGKRIRKPFPHIQWIHKVLETKGKIKEFHLEQCLFGEHQLLHSRPNQKIGIVESEKTAILMTAFYPELIWMATGSANQVNTRIFSPLKKREIILYPDLGCYELWEQKAQKLNETGFNMIISDLLEKQSSEIDRKAGWDIGDYLVKGILEEESLEVALSYEEQILEEMKGRNPVLGRLIDVFGLKLEE